MIWYLPGCDVRRNHPEAVKKMTEYLLGKGLKQAVCCRKDLSAITEEDEIIQNCTLCEMVLAERMPHNPRRSLYEYLLETDFVWPDWQGKTVTIQDCRRTKDNRALQDAVRECLHRMNIEYVEMPQNHEQTEYCGIWYNTPIAPDLPEIVPELSACLEQQRQLMTEAEQKAAMEAWVRQYQTDEVVVYCNGCERGIRLGGGHPLHMIELLTRDL